MAEYHNKNRFDGRRPSFNKGGSGFRTHTERSFGAKELFNAECNSCRNVCQVPFKPNGKKPVYCKNCFQPSTDARPRERSTRPQFTPAAPVADKRIDAMQRQLETLSVDIKALSAQVEKLSRALELGSEVRKHLPSEAAPKKVATKKAPAKGARKVAKKK